MSAGRRRAQSVAIVVCAVMLSSCGGNSPTTPTPNPPTPPPVPDLTLTCPTPPSGTSHNNQPATVTWAAPTPAGGTAPYFAVTCSPASGSQFAPGATPVTCQATDAAARTASCSFQVSVTWVPQVASTRFLGFGDSMTAGIISPAPFLLIDAPESYPYKLGQLLASRYQDQQVAVYNDGLGGEWAGDGARRLPRSLSQTNPEIVMLWEGANDLLACRGRSDFDRCIENEAIPGIIRGLRDQVRTAKASGTKVMLATHPPQRPGTQRGPAAPWVPSLNALIAALATSENATLVDLYAGFPADTSTTVGVDGLHLTDQGYTLVAQIFFDAINKTLELPYPSPAPATAR